MIRNKEIALLVTAEVIIGVITCVIAFLCNGKEILIFAMGFIISMLLYWGYTKYRYRKINQLSQYLVRIQHGDYSIDLRDYNEGELSYLKNEIYKVTLTLTEQAELLKKDKKYLSDVMSDISHQLKTPLTSMMMMTELLENEGMPKEKREEFLYNIQMGLNRMQWLVLALLKMSKLDANAVILKNEDMDVPILIQEAVNPLRIPMEIKNQTLTIEQRNYLGFTPKDNQIMDEKSEPVIISGDYTWTLEALTNIVKNCMEHTSEGGKITIAYWVNQMYCAIEISDTGEGIAKEDLPHIFERFYKGGNGSSESVGIGLALAKQIILLQNGTIEVSSTIGVGTTFLIKFYRV